MIWQVGWEGDFRAVQLEELIMRYRVCFVIRHWRDGAFAESHGAEQGVGIEAYSRACRSLSHASKAGMTAWIEEC